MSHIMQEIDVSLPALADHLELSGWGVEIGADRLGLLTEAGLGFWIRLDTDKKYLIFVTELPLAAEYTDGPKLANSLGNEVFMGAFSVDEENDLWVRYAMCYERGLIASQLSRVVRRFSGMLDYVVDKFDQEPSIFDFEKYRSVSIPNEQERILQ